MSKTKEIVKKKKISIPKSVRWHEDEIAVITGIGKTKNKKFSEFVRFCTLAYLSNLAEHESLMQSLNIEDEIKAQNTFFDAINNANETVIKTLNSMQDDLKKKLEWNEELQKRIIYLILLYNRELPQEEKDGRMESADKRMKTILS